jgi:GTPase KRas
MISIYVIGMGGVGKSSITLRFLTDVFIEEYDPTIEDSYQKTIVVDGTSEKVEIVDTAGQEEYDTMRDCWARNGEAFVVVYAINDRISFDEVETRIQELKSYKQDAVFPMIIVGNKCDLEEESRRVTVEEGKNLATSWDCPFFETSAKNSTNVYTVFYDLVREYRCMETTKRTIAVSKRSNRCIVM